MYAGMVRHESSMTRDGKSTHIPHSSRSIETLKVEVLTTVFHSSQSKEVWALTFTDIPTRRDSFQGGRPPRDMHLSLPEMTIGLSLIRSKYKIPDFWGIVLHLWVSGRRY